MRTFPTLRQWLAAALVVCFTGISQSALAVEPVPRISVSGEGSVDVAPDMAILGLTVMREGETARAALDANSSAMEAVIAAMHKEGIESRDLQTSNFSIRPRYSKPSRQGYATGEVPKVVGYTVRNGLNVRVRDISKVGAILDMSVTLGVNEGGSIHFTNDDKAAILDRARVRAVENALHKARTLAEAAGVKAGSILEISEHHTSPRPIAMARMEMAMDNAPAAVPIAAGENTYKVTVNMSLSIEQ